MVACVDGVDIPVWVRDARAALFVRFFKPDKFQVERAPARLLEWTVSSLVSLAVNAMSDAT
eukprot:6392204-Alexandrium_andersonii.AAC.1